MTVKDHSSDGISDRNINEEEIVLKITKENQVKKIVGQFETRNELKKSPCTPTRKDKRGNRDSLKKQDAAKFHFMPIKIMKQEGGKLSNSKSKSK